MQVKFWGESLMCATHIINRMPLNSIGFHYPYEKLYVATPSLKHLRIFGCLCLVSTLKANTSKFDPKS